MWDFSWFLWRRKILLQQRWGGGDIDQFFWGLGRCSSDRIYLIFKKAWVSLFFKLFSETCRVVFYFKFEGNLWKSKMFSFSMMMSEQDNWNVSSKWSVIEITMRVKMESFKWVNPLVVSCLPAGTDSFPAGSLSCQMSHHFSSSALFFFH